MMVLAAKFRLSRPSPAYHMYLPYPAAGQLLQRMFADIGRTELINGLCQDTKHVRSYIALTNDDSHLGGEIKRPVAEMRMAIVPSYEFRRGVRTWQILSRQVDDAIQLSTAAEHHCLIRCVQL